LWNAVCHSYFLKGTFYDNQSRNQNFQVVLCSQQRRACQSASQAAKRFGIKNISAEVSRVRQAGFAVYANTRMAGNGVQVTEYRIGTPSRKLVAAGYKAMALGLV
jgi:hypothetical protein